MDIKQDSELMKSEIEAQTLKNEFDTSEVKAVKRVITQVFSKGNFNPNSNDNYDYKMSNARMKMGIKDDELKDEIKHDQI